MLAILLIVGGSLGLVYGGFTYTQDTHEARLGSISLSVKDMETVNILAWLGVGAIAAGLLLLFVRNKVTCDKGVEAARSVRLVLASSGWCPAIKVFAGRAN